MRKTIVSVIGGHECSKETERIAKDLGKKLAAVCDVLVTGGLTGVMHAVCEGFKTAGGLSVGIIPTYAKCDANPFVDIVIPTGIGLARNSIVVSSADVVIALPGEAGTLSEIAYCLQLKRPVISLGSWNIPGVIAASTVDEAVTSAKELLKHKTKA
ncbi:MAG: TIGR00725 family protein [Candidatus Omnitrophica bacterium]|nr:TIGR00725 family protein [Candidatus Omnitrophota bacterium]